MKKLFVLFAAALLLNACKKEAVKPSEEAAREGSRFEVYVYSQSSVMVLDADYNTVQYCKLSEVSEVILNSNR